MPLLYCHLPTPLGEMLAIASERGMCLLEFIGQQGVEREQAQVEAARGGSFAAFGGAGGADAGTGAGPTLYHV